MTGDSGTGLPPGRRTQASCSGVRHQSPALSGSRREPGWQVPNYVEVAAPGEGLHNTEKTVRITGVREERLVGEIVDQK